MDYRELIKLPAVQELPKDPVQFIIGQRYLSGHDYLAVINNPIEPIWIPSAIANQYLLPHVKQFFKYHTELTDFFFFPHAQFYNDGKLISLFHYPAGDFYYKKLAVQQMPIKLPLQSPKFDEYSSQEQAAAKALLISYPGGKQTKEYQDVRQRIQNYVFPKVESEYFSVWGTDLDIIQVIVNYYIYKGQGRICMFGFRQQYFKICAELYKYGVYCSKCNSDCLDVFFASEDFNEKAQFELLITDKQCSITAKRKLLILYNPIYKLEYAKTLFCNETDERLLNQLFSACEIGYLNNIISATNDIPCYLPQQSKPSIAGTSCYVVSYYPSLLEVARVKSFLDTDIMAQRCFGDNKIRKEKISTRTTASYLNCAFQTMCGVLKALWVSDVDEKQNACAQERLNIVSLIIQQAHIFLFQRILIIVPDPFKQYFLTQLAKFSIKASFSINQHNNYQQLLLITESELYSLNITTKKYAQFSQKIAQPQLIILPFISTRQCELIASETFSFMREKPMIMSVLCNKTIEEQVLVYKQQLPGQCNEEYEQLLHTINQLTAPTKPDSYQQYVLTLIQKSGFDGAYSQLVYDYKNLGVQLQNSESIAQCDEFAKSVGNRYIQPEMILQASLSNLFNINPYFNIRVFAEVIYGSKFEQANKNSDYYQFPGLQWLEVQQLNETQKFYQLDQMQSFFYLCNTNFDKGREIYYNCQIPTIIQQQNINEQINKNINNTSCITAQQLIQNFLNSAKNSKISEFHQFQLTNKKNSQKCYCYLPLTKVPFTENDSFVPIRVFQRNSPLPRQPTICQECAVFTKQKSLNFGKFCDICEKPMETIADDLNFYRFQGNNNQRMKIGQFCENFEQNVSPADFIINENLSAVSYLGGLRHDNLVISGAKNQLQYDPCLNDSDTDLLLQYINIQDTTRLFTFADSLLPFTKKKQFLKAAISFAFGDYIIQRGVTITQQQLNYFEFLPFEEVVSSICNYELFIPRQIVQQHHIEVNKGQSFFDAQCQYLINGVFNNKVNEEFVQFSIKFLQKEHINTIEQRYSQNGQVRFIQQMILVSLGQVDYNYKFSNMLLASPTFQSNDLLYDNMIVQNIMSNYMCEQRDSIILKYKLILHTFISQELIQTANLFSLHKYYAQVVKSISCNGSCQFLPNDYIQATIQQLDDQNEALNQLIDPGFNPVLFLSNASALDADIKLFNQQVSDYRPPENIKKYQLRKFVQNVQKNIVIPQTPRPIVNPIASPVAPKMGSLANSSNIFHTTKQRKQVNLQLNQSFSQQQNPNQSMSFAENSMISPNQVKIQTPIRKQQPIPLLQPPKPDFYQQFDQSVKTLLKNSTMPLIRRLSDHFNPFALYAKQNLLYSPPFKTIQASQMLDQIFNQFSSFSNIEKDINFSQLIQIIANDFNMDHIQAKLYRYVRADAKQKLFEIVQQNQPLNLWYYQNSTLLLQHLLKRYILCATDFQKDQFYVFQCDPVIGKFEIDDTLKQNSFYRYCATADMIINTPPKEIDQQYEKAKSFCEKQADTQSVVESLFRFGLNVGSTPLDIYKYFLMSKNLPQLNTRLQLIQSVFLLLQICHFHKKQFPFKHQNQQILSNQLELLYNRQEIFKLVSIKIQSNSYLQVLQMIANQPQAQQSDKTEIQSILQKHQHYNEDLILSSREDQSKLDQIRYKAVIVEQMNHFQVYLDVRFAKFYQQQSQQLQFLQSCFERFSINDLDKIGIRTQYIVACQFKLLFLALFGVSEPIIANFRDTKQITQLQYDNVINYYRQILNIWSRFHDYIYLICFTECGIDSVYERIERGENKRQYFEPLRQSKHADGKFTLEKSQLYQFYLEIQSQYPTEQSQPFLYQQISEFMPSYPIFGEFAQSLKAPTTKQILQACKIFNLKNIELSKFDQTYADSRQQMLISSLFAERILYVDPLQSYIKDAKVNLLAEDRVVLRPIEQKIIKPIKNAATNVQPSAPAATTSGNPKKHQHFSAAIPLEIINEIQKKELGFYQQEEGQRQQYVADCVRRILPSFAGDLDQQLFIFSSCQKENAGVWGRLYSFLISDEPERLEVLQKRAQQQFIEIQALSVEKMNITQKVANSQLFEAIENYFNQPNVRRETKIQMEGFILQFIETQLSIAYYYAFKMRSHAINGETDTQKLKEQLHKALQSIQILQKTPLNKLVQGENHMNQRKMALATYIFLNNGLQ